jgi:hypothetical protein
MWVTGRQMSRRKPSLGPSLPLCALWILTVVALLTACEGDSGPAAGEVIASPDATETATGLPTSPPASISVGALADLESFRYSIKISLSIPEMEEELLPGFASLLSDVEIRGASIPPDRSEMWMTFKESGHAVGTLIVGGEMWFSSDGEWTQTANPTLDASLLTPEKISGAIVQEQTFAGVTPVQEALDGVPTLRYSATEEGTRLLWLLLNTEEEASAEGETSVDVWLTEEGDYPVRIAFDARSTDEEGRDALVTLEMRVTDLNDPSIEIEPPQP